MSSQSSHAACSINKSLKDNVIWLHTATDISSLYLKAKKEVSFFQVFLAFCVSEHSEQQQGKHYWHGLMGNYPTRQLQITDFEEFQDKNPSSRIKLTRMWLRCSHFLSISGHFFFQVQEEPLGIYLLKHFDEFIMAVLNSVITEKMWDKSVVANLALRGHS